MVFREIFRIICICCEFYAENLSNAIEHVAELLNVKIKIYVLMFEYGLLLIITATDKPIWK